jgi:hypothetical protein
LETKRQRNRYNARCDALASTAREFYFDFEWIVDLADRHVVALNRVELQGQVSWSECIFTGVELIKSALLAGFQVTVSDLWLDLN